MTDEEALIRLEELKKVENRPVDKKTLKRLWELRCQVYRIKDCEQKLQAAKTRQPDFGKEVTKNMDDYNTRKNAAGSSGFLAVVFILLSIAGWTRRTVGTYSILWKKGLRSRILSKCC